MEVSLMYISCVLSLSDGNPTGGLRGF